MKLELTTEQVNQILNALAQQPYIQVNELINTIQQQGQQQFQMQEANSNGRENQSFQPSNNEVEPELVQELATDAIERKNGKK